MPGELSEQDQAKRVAEKIETINRNFGPPLQRHRFELTAKSIARIEFTNDAGYRLALLYNPQHNLYNFDGLAWLFSPEDPETPLPLATIFEYFRVNNGLDTNQFDGPRTERIRTDVDRFGALFDLCADELLTTPGLLAKIRTHQSTTGVHAKEFRPDEPAVAAIEWRPYNLRDKDLHQPTLDRFQTDAGIRFPDDYLDLVAEHMGRSPDFAEVKVGSFAVSPGYLLGYVEGSVESPRDHPHTVPYRYVTMVEFLGYPERVIPFMTGSSGDLAFDYRQCSAEPPVVFVDSESEPDESFHAVAPSFQQFIREKLVAIAN